MSFHIHNKSMDDHMISHTDRYSLYTQGVDKYLFYYKFSIIVTLSKKRWIFNAFNVDSQL